MKISYEVRVSLDEPVAMLCKIYLSSKGAIFLRYADEYHIRPTN